MIMNQDTLKFIFGIKLRGLRLDKGLSLKELARKSGLSPSYINEIEKGKKYPKSEKIVVLADALQEKYEDLVSLQLKRNFQLVQNLLDKKFLGGIPFDLFGIPESTVFELLSERPKKMQALVGTILEIARAHNIKGDDFLYALLRSYISMQENYFPALEEAARQVSATLKLPDTLTSHDMKSRLVSFLSSHKMQIFEIDLETLSPDFKDLNYFTNVRGKKLYLSKKLPVRDQNFILAREVGYHFLKLKERPQSSLVINIDSFAQLFNHFSAGYFASSFLVPEQQIKSDLRSLFTAPEWSLASFQQMLEKYPCSFENVFHRVTQMLPQHFGLKELFFLRYEYDTETQKYEIARELHLSSHHDPHKVIGNEHYCSRWLIHRLTQTQIQKPDNATIGIQRSRYAGSENEYLIMGLSTEKPASTSKITTVCIGLAANDALKNIVSWSASPKIPAFIVGETCERCTFKDCPDRKAPLNPKLDPEKYDRVFKALQEFTNVD